MHNDESPGNDRLTKEFVSFLWCVLHSFGKGELCTSQRQASIKLIEKKKKINSKLEADFSTK